jgi:hypothetical protein
MFASVLAEKMIQKEGSRIIKKSQRQNKKTPSCVQET